MEFEKLADVFEKMESTSSRLTMTADLAALFSKTEPGEIRKIVYLCQGILAPEHEGLELGMGDKLAQQALRRVTGTDVEKIEALYRKSGDLGETGQALLEKKAQKLLAQEPLTTQKFLDNVSRIATASGPGSQETKIKFLAELLANATPREAKIIIRFVQGQLRLGIGSPTILDALSTLKANDKSLRPMLERAFNLRSDLGLVAELLLQGKMAELESLRPQPGSPIRPALAERLLDAAAILEKIGPCNVEGKYDGFRLQVHKLGSHVELFSRKQERMTDMFPDLVEAVGKEIKAHEVIFEGEAIAYDDKRQRFQPFQVTIQRRRKHDIAAKATEIPLRLFAFELLYADGKDYTGETYQDRRTALGKMISGKARTISLTEAQFVKTPAELERYFEKCLEKGLEGIIAKDVKAPYVAGARKFAWIKLKRSYGKLTDTFDLVILGYYKGKGKRTQFEFGGLLTGIYDPTRERFRTLARIGTGFSEEQMGQLHELLEPLEVPRKPANVDSDITPDAWVQPQIVVEVNADELSKSPQHTAGRQEDSGEGLALRFPRMVALRSDKEAQEATTEEEVLELYEIQQQRYGQKR